MDPQKCLAETTVRKAAEALEALGVSRETIAEALFVQALARGRYAQGDDYWIKAMTAAARTMAGAKEGHDGH